MSKPAKELVPALRFPEFRDAEVWELSSISNNSTKVGSGITPRGGATNYKAEGRPFIRSQNVGWGNLLLDEVVYIDEAIHSTFAATEIKSNDVLLNITGASIGRSAIADERISGGNVNQHVCIIRVKPDELVPLFLNQFLISDDGQRQIDSFQAGGNREGLNFAQIRSFNVPLPKPPEQQKIAACLSSLDDLIAAQGRKVEALARHKKGLMQQLFPATDEKGGQTTPRLRFPEFRDAGPWEEKRLKDISPAIFDGTHQTPNYKTKGVPFFSVENIVSGKANKFISKSDYDVATRKNKPEKGDVIITRIGKLGFSKVIDWDYDFSIYVTLAVIKRAKYFNSFFLHFYMQSARYQAEIIGKSLLNAVPCKTNMDELRNTLVLLPKPPEQQKIAACLSSLDDLIAAERRKVEALARHKKGLMQQLFPATDEGAA